MQKTLYKNPNDAIIGGVCSGIAEYLEADVSLIRIIAAILLVAGWGSPVLVYIILWVVLPDKPFSTVTTSPEANPSPTPDEPPVAPPVDGEPAPRPADVQNEQGSTGPVDEFAEGAAKFAATVAAGAQHVAKTVSESVKEAVAEEKGTASDQQASGATPYVEVAHSAAGKTGYAFGIVLIVFGLLALIGRFYLAAPFWAYWPLIIVTIGVVQIFTPESRTKPWDITRPFEGAGTIVWGLVLLGCTTGVLSWRLFLEFISLWPVLVIAAGLAIIGASLKLKIVRILGSLLVTATLLVAASTSFLGWEMRSSGWGMMPFMIGMHSEMVDYEISEPLSQTKSGVLELRNGIGDIEVEETDGTQLFSMEGRAFGGEPSAIVEREGTAARVIIDDLQQGASSSTVGPSTKLRLSDRVGWEVRMKAAASSSKIDLSGLKVSSLRLEIAASEARVTLGTPVESSGANVVIDSAASSVSLRVPDGVPVKITSQSAIAGNTYSGLTKGSDGAWYSAGYDEAVSAGDLAWDINVNSAVGAFEFATYR